MFAGVHAALRAALRALVPIQIQDYTPTPALAQVFKTTTPLFVEMGLEDLTNQFGSLMTVGELMRVELRGKTE